MKRPVCLIGLAALALPGVPAGASGYVPMPELRETLPSFRACLARLQSAYDQDRKAVTPRTLAADGTIREVSLQTDTKGLERSGKARARYHGKLWYSNGGLSQHDPAQREVHHSWEEHDMRCEGRQLTIKGANGYTLSTFEAVQ